MLKTSLFKLAADGKYLKYINCRSEVEPILTIVPFYHIHVSERSSIVKKTEWKGEGGIFLQR